jgi:hypothetical protein
MKPEEIARLIREEARRGAEPEAVEVEEIKGQLQSGPSKPEKQNENLLSQIPPIFGAR